MRLLCFCFVFLINILTSNFVSASGFDCRSASLPSDFVICSRPDIIAANDSLAEEWHLTRAGMTDAKKSALLADQKTWLKSLNSQCELPEHGKPSDQIIQKSQNCVLTSVVRRAKTIQLMRNNGSENPRADDPDNPGFGNCDPVANHAEVPNVKNMNFKKARKTLLEAGWRPRITTTKSPDGSVLAHGDYVFEGWRLEIWSKYNELDDCAGDVEICRFNYQDSFGNRLIVFSEGEEMSSAKAGFTELLCQKK